MSLLSHIYIYYLYYSNITAKTTKISNYYFEANIIYVIYGIDIVFKIVLYVKNKYPCLLN